MITGGGPVGMLFLHTLGTAQIDAGHTRVTPTSGRKFAFLLHLSAEPGRRVSREVLRDLLFPDLGEDSAKHSLRELVFRLRRIGVRIDADKDGVALATDAVASDYRAFLEGERPEASQLTAAAGGFLPGYAPAHSEAYSEWLEGYRASATFEICKALLKELARAKRVGDWAQAERAARACLALDPLNEEATLGLAEMLAIGGAKVAAVRLLDAYVTEVGRESGDLTVSAKILRRRIGEPGPEKYRSTLEFPFVGREREMALLTDKLGDVKSGACQLIVVSGSAGIGKSRLAAEFGAYAKLSGAAVEVAAVRAHHQRQPLSAFVDLIPRLIQLPGALGSSPASLSRLRLLTGHDDSESAEHGDPHVSVEQAMDDLIGAVCAENPVILLIEDAHWLDKASRELCCELVGGGAKRLMILLTSREPSIVTEFPKHTDNSFHIPVAPLRPHVVEQLVRDTVAEANPDVYSWMVQISAGNPLFLSSLILHFRSTGQQVVPTDVTDLIAQRVARVGTRPLNVLRMCAILAEQCTVNLLVDALEIPHIELLDALTELERHELVRLPGERITTAHPLVDETVLANCSPSVLAIMHRRAANIIECAVQHDANASLLWACANHWVSAGVKERAAAALRRCADHSLRIGRPHEAGAVLERAYQLMESDQARGDIARNIVCAYSDANDLRLASRWATTARALAPVRDHDEYELLEIRSNVLAGFDIDAAEPRLVACVESGASDEHRLEAGMLLSMLAEVYDRPAALERIQSEVDRITSRLHPRSEARLGFAMMYEAALGHVTAAADSARQIVQLTELAETPKAARLHFNAAIVCWRAGHVDEALRTLETAFIMAGRSGMIGLQISIVADAAHLLHCSGRSDVAIAWMAVSDTLENQNRRVDRRWDHISLRAYHAIQQGDVDRACRLLKCIPTPPPYPEARPTRWISACRVRLDVLRGNAVPDAQIQALIDRSHRDNGSGEEPDLEIEAAWHALLSMRRSNDAQALAADYVERTRLRLHPYSYGIQRLLEHCGIRVPAAKLGRLAYEPRNPWDLLASIQPKQNAGTPGESPG